MRPPFPSAVEGKEAERLGIEHGDRLRKQAALLIRCGDCNGELLATVTWVGGRPLAAAREQGDRLVPEKNLPRQWLYSWADRGAVLTARIGAHRHVLDLGYVETYLRRSERNMKVRHTDEDGVVRP